MKIEKSYILLLTSIILAFTLMACNITSSREKSALEPVNKLISTLYFNKGSYEDYKNLFTNPQFAFNEDQFNSFRKNPDKTSFKYGNNSTEEIMQHMKAVPEDANLVTVYYLEDVDKTEISKALLQWRVENKDGKWLLKND